jgi:hypothetical protein
MSLIRAAENIVGSIENWPTHILEHLFCEIPNLEALEGLIAFFYGNGIPCHVACQLYHACNSKSTAIVTEQFYTTYCFWESCTHEVHLAQYFDMRLKKYVYINGRYRDPCELVQLQLPVKMGIDNTPFPTIIRCWLNRIRSSVDYY